jgi:hypothetical protein
MQQPCVIWMHKKKEEAILRIFAKESLNLAGHEGTDYTLVWCSPGLERRWQRGFEVVLLELREEGRRVGMGAAKTGQEPQPL